HGISRRILALAHRAPERPAAVFGTELLERDGEADAFEYSSRAKHHIIPHCIAHRLGLPDVYDALVDRHAAAQPETQHRDNQAPKIKLPTVAERVFGRSGPLAQTHADE